MTAATDFKSTVKVPSAPSDQMEKPSIAFNVFAFGHTSGVEALQHLCWYPVPGSLVSQEPVKSDQSQEKSENFSTTVEYAPLDVAGMANVCLYL